MLQIAVGHLGFAQLGGQPHPDLTDDVEKRRLIDVVLDELVERETLDQCILRMGYKVPRTRMPCSRKVKSTMKGNGICLR